MDRYRETETIMRREGIRFDGTMKRLVDEMRARDDLGREFLEERRLLNKQWEKREKEIIMALKREARKVELKEEALADAQSKVKELEQSLSEATESRRSLKRGLSPPPESRPWPFLPSELEEKVAVLSMENATLRAENERLLTNLGALDKELQHSVASGAESRPKTGSIRKRAASSVSSPPDEREVSSLVSEFMEGGSKRMTSEVTRLVSESGKILGKIQDLEKGGRAGGGEDSTGGEGDAGRDDGEATVFMSPYLYDDMMHDDDKE